MDLIATVGPLILFFVIFYFILIRPQQKRQRRTKEMQSSLQKGDRIVTIGGLHGTIDTMQDDQITIKSHNSKLTFDRTSIRDVVQKKEAGKETVTDGDED